MVRSDQHTVVANKQQQYPSEVVQEPPPNEAKLKAAQEATPPSKGLELGPVKAKAVPPQADHGHGIGSDPNNNFHTSDDNPPRNQMPKIQIVVDVYPYQPRTDPGPPQAPAPASTQAPVQGQVSTTTRAQTPVQPSWQAPTPTPAPVQGQVSTTTQAPAPAQPSWRAPAPTLAQAPAQPSWQAPAPTLAPAPVQTQKAPAPPTRAPVPAQKAPAPAPAPARAQDPVQEHPSSSNKSGGICDGCCII